MNSTAATRSRDTDTMSVSEIHQSNTKADFFFVQLNHFSEHRGIFLNKIPLSSFKVN